QVPKDRGSRRPAHPRARAAAEGRGGLEIPRRGEGGGAARLRGGAPRDDRQEIMRWLALLALLAGCPSSSGPEEVKLSKRSCDAGPAVIVVDKLTDAVGQTPVEEKEPNDARSGGQPLSLPGAVRGRIDKADDWDVYKVAIPQPGTLRVTLTGVDDADLVLEVQGPG